MSSRAVAVALVALGLLCFDVSSVSADAADPILASTTGTIVLNPDGSRTVTVHGGWQWTTHRSNCNNDKRSVGYAVDWFDPTQPGNLVTTLNGSDISVGVASGDRYNPADNLVHPSPPATESDTTATWRGGCGTYDAARGYNTGDWGPLSHTYPPSVTGPITLCVLVYDVHLQTNGGAPNKASEIAAGGTNHNHDNSSQENTHTPLGNGCFQTDITSPPPVTTTTATTGTTTSTPTTSTTSTVPTTTPTTPLPTTTTTSAPPTPTGEQTPPASATPCPDQTLPPAVNRASLEVRLVPVPAGL